MFLRIDADNAATICQLAQKGGFEPEAVANEILREYFKKLSKRDDRLPTTVWAEAARLRRLNHLTWKEIGERLGVNPNTLRGRYSEGKR